MAIKPFVYVLNWLLVGDQLWIKDIRTTATKTYSFFMMWQDRNEIFHFPSRVRHMFPFNTSSVYRMYTVATDSSLWWLNATLELEWKVWGLWVTENKSITLKSRFREGGLSLPKPIFLKNHLKRASKQLKSQKPHVCTDLRQANLQNIYLYHYESKSAVVYF